MNKYIAIFTIGMWLALPLSAQNDDVYFTPSKSKKATTTSTKVATSAASTTGSTYAATRDVDEYNRRGYYYNSDTLYLDEAEGDTLYLDGRDTPQYYYGDDAYNPDDYEYSYRLSRFYSPGLIISVGDPYWGYYGYYDPWYYSSWRYPYYYGSSWYYGGWYSPWYYNSWYSPWYYGGYYHHHIVPHYGGGVVGRISNGYAHHTGTRTGVSSSATRVARASASGARANSALRAGTGVRAGSTVRSTTSSSAASRSYNNSGTTTSPARANSGSTYSQPSRSYSSGSTGSTYSAPSRSSSVSSGSMGGGRSAAGGQSVSRGGRR